MAQGFFKKPGDAVRAIDREISSLALFGAVKAAERTVDELQAEGPSWTGRFSNSWQIDGPQGQAIKGDGQPGEPQPLRFREGPFTGPQATATLLRTTFLKDKVIFKISNFAPHAAKAIDAVQQDKRWYPEGWRISPDGPSTSQGQQNHRIETSGRKDSSYRGEIGGGDPDTISSNTAPLDWYATFAQGGRLDKAIKVEMDAALRRAFK
jgi:hypothetical protein